MKKVLLTLAVLQCSWLCAPAAHAEGFYLAAEAGQTSFEVPGTSGDFQVDQTSYRGIIGLRNDYGAFEIGYTDLGSIEETDGSQTLNADGNAWTAMFVGILPVAKYFEVNVKAGYAQWSSGATVEDMITTVKSDDGGGNFVYGLGFAFPLGKRFGLRLDYDNFGDFGQIEGVKFLSAGVQFNF
jgi:hypothetical protein